ncbi:MAG TPA: hypothetical protein VL793_07550, partial [Patescibacteria group bacterium]|nr:hypothetical protein [Patescibacteria group bacterium]
MNKYSQTVDQSFVNAQRRWRRIRLLRNGSIGGLLLCCFAFVLGMAIVRGWVSTRQEAIWILAGVGLLAGAGLVKAVITIIVTTPGRVSIAAELERTDPRFQDRLNTLLFLENSKTRPESVSFLKRIADQARRVLMQKKPPAPFSAGGALLWTSAFVTMLACLGWLNHRYAPWARLKLSPGIGLAQSGSSAQQPESPLPARSQDPARQDWGEIRVVEPGTDLTATKVDVVPLSIEAAANQDLVRIEWLSSVNGGKEKEHELPPPSEPRYAVYQPIIYLDELELSDWDVLTY